MKNDLVPRTHRLLKEDGTKMEQAEIVRQHSLRHRLNHTYPAWGDTEAHRKTSGLAVSFHPAFADQFTATRAISSGSGENQIDSLINTPSKDGIASAGRA